MRKEIAVERRADEQIGPVEQAPMRVVNFVQVGADDELLRFETLATVSAEEASIPVGGKCASLAAQVAHVTFFIESFERFALQGDNSPRDWGLIWRTVEKVTPEEWEDYKAKLKAAYLRMDKLFHENPTWNEDTIGGALSIVVHTAYHLGEIRQALCTLK